MSDELPVTTPARTALDIARHLPRDVAVVHLDALAAATGVTCDDVIALANKYRGARGIRRARTALALMDGGAQSPEETRLRLVLIDAGLPAPRTQIRVSDGFNEAFIDMGYDEPMVGLDYEGAHHSENRGQYVYDIGRADLIDRQGWIDIRVVKEHSRRYIIHRVREAFRAAAGLRRNLHQGRDCAETTALVQNSTLLGVVVDLHDGKRRCRHLGDGHLRGGVGGDDVAAQRGERGVGADVAAGLLAE